MSKIKALLNQMDNGSSGQLEMIRARQSHCFNSSRLPGERLHNTKSVRHADRTLWSSKCRVSHLQAKSSNYNYADDVFTIGAFHALMQGILTSASAGNEGGFGSSTVTNSAPWVLTVAASVDDRDFVSTVQLGNGGTLEGYGLNHFQMDDFNGVIKASYAALFGVSTEDASSCKRNSLDTDLIQGKIVVCTIGSWNDDKATMGSNGGGVRIIVVDPNDVKSTEIYNIPTSVITPKEAKMLQEYLISARWPVAKISPSKARFKSKSAPRMAYFSSKGSTLITPEIIKPDITVPGVNILAAWHAMGYDNWDFPNYNIDSGTSMACPHFLVLLQCLKPFVPIGAQQKSYLH